MRTGIPLIATSSDLREFNIESVCLLPLLQPSTGPVCKSSNADRRDLGSWGQRRCCPWRLPVVGLPEGRTRLCHFPVCRAVPAEMFNQLSAACHKGLLISHERSPFSKSTLLSMASSSLKASSMKGKHVQPIGSTPPVAGRARIAIFVEPLLHRCVKSVSGLCRSSYSSSECNGIGQATT